MSASLVGSEMCIRDSPRPGREISLAAERPEDPQTADQRNAFGRPWGHSCLLYTSDAADDM
eukprot:13022792-Alexandrium_andersonii.AAC.1